jgi:hypothetical protein
VEAQPRAKNVKNHQDCTLSDHAMVLFDGQESTFSHCSHSTRSFKIKNPNQSFWVTAGYVLPKVKQTGQTNQLKANQV